MDANKHYDGFDLVGDDVRSPTLKLTPHRVGSAAVLSAAKSAAASVAARVVLVYRMGLVGRVLLRLVPPRRDTAALRDFIRVHSRPFAVKIPPLERPPLFTRRNRVGGVTSCQSPLKRIVHFICVAFGLALALASSAADAPADFTFTDLRGVVRHPLEPGDRIASVLVFFWHDCPMSNAYAPELNRIAAAHTNFAFYIVQVDSDLTVAAAKEHARSFALRPPVLMDSQHRLVKRVGATVTPEAVVVGKNGAVLYRGRIDDGYASLGKKRAAVTEHDLIDALDALAAGRPLKRTETKSPGCLIQ